MFCLTEHGQRPFSAGGTHSSFRCAAHGGGFSTGGALQLPPRHTEAFCECPQGSPSVAHCAGNQQGNCFGPGRAVFLLSGFTETLTSTISDGPSLSPHHQGDEELAIDVMDRLSASILESFIHLTGADQVQLSSLFPKILHLVCMLKVIVRCLYVFVDELAVLPQWN